MLFPTQKYAENFDKIQKYISPVIFRTNLNKSDTCFAYTDPVCMLNVSLNIKNKLASCQKI